MISISNLSLDPKETQQSKDSKNSKEESKVQKPNVEHSYISKKEKIKENMSEMTSQVEILEQQYEIQK